MKTLIAVAVLGGIALVLNLRAKDAPKDKSNDKSDIAVAKCWLKTLKANNAAELTKATALPFTFATTYTRFQKCEGTLKTATAFSRWANCVRKPENHLGLAPFEVQRELGLEARYLKTCEDYMDDADALSEEKSLDILAKKVSANGTWVRTCTSASEIQYHCRWLVVKGADGSRQIAAFLMGHVVYE